MLQQLLWTEVALKGSLGIILAFAPSQTAAVLGLPATGNGFWARLVGVLLLAISGSLLLQGSVPVPKMITPGGLIVINLACAAMLISVLVLGKASTTRRGNALLWVSTAGLTLLSLVEIAFV